MKIGYACINNSIKCTSNSTFRLKNYSEENLISKISNNLNCLFMILKWNVENKICFFRISSDLIPFASHPICKFNWQEYFKKDFNEIGKFIKENKIRISMHPDQFVLINSPKKDIVDRSIAELNCHANVLDALDLDETAKIQIHVGGIYGDKKESTKRFIENYKALPDNVKRRLVIENEERMYSLKDCIEIYKATKVPVLFDFFHHSLFNNGETIKEAISLISKTWTIKDGTPMTDYSSQKEGSRFGAHTESINLKDFKIKVEEAKLSGVDFDVMLEIKDKEKSCLRAIRLFN